MKNKFVRFGSMAIAVAFVFGALADAEKDFDAAIREGRPLSAEAAYRRLVQEKPQLAPIRHFQAAKAADLCGDATKRRDRLALFVRLEKNWNENVEQALWYLSATGSDVDYFERLAANANRTEDAQLWSVGRGMLGRLDGANRPAEVLRLATILVKRFPEKERVESTLNVVWESIQRNPKENYPTAELKKFMMSDGNLWKYDRFYHFRHNSNLRDNFPFEFMAEYAAKYGNMGSDSLQSFLQWFDADYNGETNATKLATIDARVDLAKKLKKVCFDGKHSAAAYYYYRAIQRNPRHFTSKFDAKTGYVPGLYKLYCQLDDVYGDRKDTVWWFKEFLKNASRDSINWGRWNDQEKRDFVEKNADTVDLWMLLKFSSLGDVCKQADEEKEPAKKTAGLNKLCQKFPKRADEIRRNQLRYYAAAGDRAAVKDIVLKGVQVDTDFDFSHYVETGLMGCKDMPTAERVQILRDAYMRTGYSGAWGEFRKRADKAPGHQVWFFTNTLVKAFAKEIRDDAKAIDPVLRAYKAMAAAKDVKAAEAAWAEADKAFTWKLGDKAHAAIEGRYQWIVRRYWERINGDKAACERFVDAVLPKIQKESSISWDMFDHCCRKVDKNDLWVRYNKARARIYDDDGYLAWVRAPRDAEKMPVDGVEMKKMSARQAWDYCWNNQNIKEPAKTQLVFDYCASRPLASNYWDGAARICERMRDVAYDKNFGPKIPYDSLQGQLFGPDRLALKSWGAMWDFMRMARRLGKTKESLAAFIRMADGVTDPFTKYALYRDLLNIRTWVATPDGKGRDEWVLPDYRSEEMKTADFWGPIFREKFLPALKALPARQLPFLDFNMGSSFWEHVRNYRGGCWKDGKLVNENGAKATEEFYATVTRFVTAGARASEGYNPETMAWHHMLRKGLTASNAVEIATYARRAASSLGTWWVGEREVYRFLDDLKACGNDEAYYLYVDAVPGDQPGDVVARAAKARAAVASKLPGIYPVAENDPAYPLYVAAEEYSRRNSERAWQIMQDRRNVTAFEREALKLPPDFVVWTIEQYRLARGEKDALLLKARQLATMILSQESKISPEMAAAMILTRAESFRDQQNFEAAKLEYQSIRENPAYQTTKYGKKAMFRATDLMIDSGNAQGVESTLEYWLSQPDQEIQAQAHYFQALIAFERKDYDETIKQLRATFAIDFTHTEGRILHAKWKLATNSEVDDTDVLLGDLSNRDMIRPGNQLSISVQDANLSVAGGGATIPVIVTAELGGDVECINLYPSSRDPSNFKGIVEVALGKAVPSNRVLQVRGDDTVSYVIDPAFLKERGLPLNKPRKLRVIDDSKLAIGAGAPRTDEKKTEKGMKSLLEDDRNIEDSGVVRSLRPGNPLYVVVQDRDCSFGGASNSVPITVETSSGDCIANVPLYEEKPFTGVFRGKIPTALPPPRAFASDTAAGLNAGDAINEKKTTVWKSLADGQPGKWFEVDTMASYLMSNVTLKTTSAADIKRIRLVGRMGSKVITLGSLPAGDALSKLYLRRQQQYDSRAPRSLAGMRAFCATDKAQRPTIVTNIAFRSLHKDNNWRPQSCYYSGPFVMPSGYDHLRFRIQAVNPRGDPLKGVWLAVAIDGNEVFAGQGAGLHNQIFSFDMDAGCHRFEMAVVGCRGDDGFDLLWEPLGGEAGPVPYAWFNEEIHDELKDFVKDIARIARTPEGFVATFDKPTRLRSVRWEFADVKSPDVQVEKMFAWDVSGEQVLPVASDYSDSLNNATLEVAPGDRITVKYVDERTTNGEKKMLQRDMNSSFNNAKARFIFEDTDDRGNIVANDAYRFQPGDALVMCVEDPDLDVSDEADKAVVKVICRDGKELRKTLVEYRPKWSGAGDEDMYGLHSGIFLGVLKTCEAGDTNAPASVLRVDENDALTVAYEDRENTDPGVPTERTAKIQAIKATKPILTLFDTFKTQEIDRSADAKVKLERIRRRPGNENVDTVYCDVFTAKPMDPKALGGEAPALVNVAAPIPLRVNDPSSARHAGSKVYVEAVAQSEIDLAESEGRDPDKVRLPLKLGGSLAPFKLLKGGESAREARTSGSFNGVIRLSLGPIDPNIEVPENAPPMLCVTGSDRIKIDVLSEDGQSVLSQTLQLVSDASMGLTDSSFEAERNSAHIGESFFVKVDDADRDATDEPDTVEATVVSSTSGVKRPIVLKETMPHSGIFTGRLRPVMFAPGETIPNVATGGVASAHEVASEERFAVKYGDKVIFRYRDERVLPGSVPHDLAVTGTVFRGANGGVRMFSKRFRDRDTAVLVQFRLAECLFEQAKEHRKLKQPEKSSAAIAEGKFILEEALKNYPDSSHVVQGEYLLANLYQELATEAKEAEDMEKATPLYQDALSRFSQILGTWPESEYAPRSQYHKALCLEMLGDYSRAGEEYVKMTYVYPESDLVGEATIRLATYYYTKEKRFDISGRIYRNFQQRFPQHDKAARSLFMAGSCFIKQAEAIVAENEKRKAAKQALVPESDQKISDCYRDAVKTFDTLVEEYRDTAPAKLKAQTLYWAGDVCVRRRDYAKAYRYLKQTVFEYPETEWARRARGLLLQESRAFKEFE